MPKTLAEALTLLAAERERAAELEAAAKQAQTVEGILRNQLATLRDELSAERSNHSTLRDELTDERAKVATLRDELTDERRKLVETELQCRKEENRADRMEMRYHSLDADRERAEAYSTELEEEIERVRGKTEDVRFDLELKLDGLRRESDEHRQAKERVVKEHDGLTRRFDELRGRLDESERTLKLRDEDLTQQRRNFVASERAHREIHEAADSVVRSLVEERSRRLVAERHVEQLQQKLWQAMTTPPSLLGDAQRLTMLHSHNSILATELQAVRHHRDVAIEEQRRLAARLLHLMSPGRYLEHAAAAGYDISTDPLIQLMQQSVLVESRREQWQEATGKVRRARAWDSSQTLVEQAYAAAIAKRWSHINKPDKAFKPKPYWLATGILLDSESERYLLEVTDKRIAWMQNTMPETEG